VNEDKIRNISEIIIKEGKKCADEVEVFLAGGSSVEAQLKGDLIGEAGGSESFGIGIRLIKGGKIGSSTTGNPDRWQECLAAAEASAKLATGQKWEGLPSPVPLSDIDLDIFDSSLKPDISVASSLIEEMKEGASDFDVNIAGGGSSLGTGYSVIVNSEGVFYAREKSRISVSLEAISGTSTGYEFDSACFTDRIDAKETGKQAAFLAAHSVNAEEIESGNYDVIFSPVAFGQLLGSVLMPSFSGRNVHSNRSFLAGKLDEQLFDECLCIYDDPMDGQGSTFLDAEGVPTRRIDFVSDGVLKSFAYDLKTAYRYGEESTGSAKRGGAGGLPSIGMHNLHVDGERSDIFDEKALYVHDVVGAHTANAITGDFSLELSNTSWMESGEYGSAVRSAMVSGNFFEMMKNIGGLSESSREIGSSKLPSVRFNSIRIIGK